MDDFEVGPEEPLFYIGLLLVLVYFIYLVSMHLILKVKKKKALQALQADIVKMESYMQTNSQKLKTELGKHYSSEWIDTALKGQIFENMPAVLLKLALGSPNKLRFNGENGEEWHYGSIENTGLIVNVWNKKVASWHQFN